MGFNIYEWLFGKPEVKKVPKAITPELVKNAWKYMSSVYGSTVVTKSNSAFMTAVGSFLDTIGVLDKNTFMNHYTTTIGKTIYTSFEIGDPSNVDLYSQLVICAHEHQHIVQSNKMGQVNYNVKYLTSKDERARLEAEAYRSALELCWYYYKTTPDTLRVANTLKNYALEDKHIQVVNVSLQSAVRSIRNGAVLNEATKTILTIL